MKNELLKIGKNDFVKGFIMAILTAIVTALYTSIQSGKLPSTIEDFKVIGLSSLSAGLVYLMKNFLSNSEGEFLKKDA